MTVQGNRVPGPFDDAWIKCAWGIRHAQQLRREITAFQQTAFSPETFGGEAKYDAKRRGFAIICTRIPSFPTPCGLLLGDTVHNLRSVFDHVAWAMVDRGRTPLSTLPDRTLKRIAFPVCDHKAAANRRGDTPGWVDSCRNKLPGVTRADRNRP